MDETSPDRPVGTDRLDRPTLGPVERPASSAVLHGDTPPRRRPIVPWLLTATALAFALGVIANPWFERNVRSYFPGAAQLDAATPETEALRTRVATLSRELAALDARVEALEARPAIQQPALNEPSAGPAPAGQAGTETDNATGERLARVETRLDTLDQQLLQDDQRLDNLQAEVAGLTVKIGDIGNQTAASLRAAATGAQRAQAVLLISSTRRALESGNRLGALEPALRSQFDQTHGQAVEAVIALGQQPVTLARLRRDFARLRPALIGASRDAAPDRGWWQSLLESLDGIVEVRRSGAPAEATSPTARIDQATRQLAQGNVAGAMASIGRLAPSTGALAADWLDDARRYVVGNRALAQLEAVTLNAPAVPATPAAPTPAPTAPANPPVEL